MGIKTVPRPPYCPDLGPCDFWLFPKLRGCRYETIEEIERVCDEGHWHAHIRGLPWGLPVVVGTVQQVHCSRRRLLRRGLEFHVCTINKIPIQKSQETYLMILRKRGLSMPLFCILLSIHRWFNDTSLRSVDGLLKPKLCKVDFLSYQIFHFGLFCFSIFLSTSVYIL